MFYDIDKAIKSCEDDPQLLFVAIKNNYRDVYEKVLQKEDFNFNTTDEYGNNVLMRLVKNKDFDLVNKYVLNKDLLINYTAKSEDTALDVSSSTYIIAFLIIVIGVGSIGYVTKKTI